MPIESTFIQIPVTTLEVFILRLSEAELANAFASHTHLKMPGGPYQFDISVVSKKAVTFHSLSGEWQQSQLNIHVTPNAPQVPAVPDAAFLILSDRSLWLAIKDGKFQVIKESMPYPVE